MKGLVHTYYTLLLLACICSPPVKSFAHPHHNRPKNCTNYVLIEGSSNINSFEFIHAAPRLVQSDKSTWSHQVTVPVKEFTGSNQHMRNDFLKLLKAAKYPEIKIKIEPEEKADKIKPGELTAMNAHISLAGNQHNYLVPCKISSCDSSEVMIEGALQIKLTDFNIDPPKKVLGVVKVNDEVFITFAFKHEFVN
ncbi:YceI family protein [uncultured Draconibacterium sp.]|uniref:YceI family protein n=1 Tax=uncultured Draconibacterium sp. TaxID=1573823 RepID=UPI0025FF8E9C|nr:YceI family protein [uncultured Draconibacterium sp.]